MPTSTQNADSIAFAGGTLYVSAELMRNQVHVSAIPADDKLAVVQDAAGKPLIFTIGNDGSFDLIQWDDQTAGGWSVVSLSSGFAGYKTARSFAVSQDRTGLISVAVALSKDDTPVTDIFLATMLSSDAKVTAWAKFSTLAAKVAGVDAAFGAVNMVLGTSDDSNAPTLFATGRIGGRAVYYQVSAGVAVQWQLPDAATPDSTLGVAPGSAFGDRGIYLLYNSGQSQTMVFTSIVPAGKRPVTLDYSPTHRDIVPQFPNLHYNCFAIAPGSETDPEMQSSDVFIGTESGVYLARGARVSDGGFQKIPGELQDVHQLIVREDAAHIVIWAVCGPNRLYYILGTKGDTYKWNAPILFSSSCFHVAPIRSQQRRANELFVVDQEKNLTHYWQDPGTTLWHQRTLRDAAGKKAIDFHSYTTHIHLSDLKGVAIPNRKLKLTTSEWTYAIVNGLLYSLDKDTPAEVPTDGMGNVTIIYTAGDISCPIVHLEADFIDKTVNIYPNGKVSKGLNQIHSGDDLRNARTQDGKPVYTGTHSADTVNGMAANVQKLSSAGQKFMGGSQVGTFTAVAAKGVRHDGILQAHHVPAGFVAGMHLSGGVWQHTPQPHAHAMALSLGGFGGEIVDLAGDALHFLENAFSDGLKLVEQGVTFLKDGVSFVIHEVEGMLNFVLKIADKVLRIALKTLGAVFKALSWVLKLIGIDLMLILKWLGFLFDWTDILETSDKIIALFDLAIDGAIAAIPQVKSNFDGVIDSAADFLGDPSLTSRFGAVGGNRAEGGASSIFQSPAINWPLYQIFHGGLLPTINVSLDPSGAASIRALSGQFTSDQFFNAGTAVQAVFESFVDAVRSGTIVDAVRKVAEVLALAALQTVKACVDALLDLAAVCLNALRSALHSSLELPILGILIEFILGGRELNVLRAVAIVLAIPARIVYRVLHGRSLDNDAISIGPVPPPAPPPHRRTMALGAVAFDAAPTPPVAPPPAQTPPPVESIPDWIPLFYELSNFIGTGMASVTLFGYVSGKQSDRNITILQEAFSLIGLGCMLRNYEIIHGHYTPRKPFEWAAFCSQLTAKIATVGSIVEEEYRPFEVSTARTIKAVISLVTVIPLSIGFSKEEKNRPNNMRFSSGLFLTLYKTLGQFPFQLGPSGAAGVTAGCALFGFTHVSMVQARVMTDSDDHVTFSLI